MMGERQHEEAARTTSLIPHGDLTSELADAYAEYTRDVSPNNMAMSLESAGYLLFLCRSRRAKRVADFGSGFSSYVLAHHAETADYEVLVDSVDDDRDWMAKSEQFCAAHSMALTDHRFYLWDFYAKQDHKLDLSFHDLASGAKREAAMSYVADWTVPGGVVMFDDAHHVGHRQEMGKVCRDRGWRCYPLHDWTRDSYGRFSALGMSPNPNAVGPVTETIAYRYARACQEPSDIYEHLPVFVRLCVELDAKQVIELGTRSGVSTVAWLYGLDMTAGHLWSVDLNEAPDLLAYEWTFMQGNDLDPALVAALPSDADVVFIDTSHHYAQTLAELNVYRWKVRPGGKIVLHDTELAHPEGWTRAQPPYPVKTAVNEFCRDEGLHARFSPQCWGLAIIDIPE